MNENWIKATSVIMEVMEGIRQGLPMETFQALSVNTIYEELDADAAAVDTSMGLALRFQNIIKDIFKNREIKVVSNSYKTLTSCPWASVVFHLNARKLGLHFTLKEPFFEVFIEPTGDGTKTEEKKKKHKPVETPNPEPTTMRVTAPPDPITTGEGKSSDSFNSKFGRRFG
jgi:hypothetical protein